MSFDVAWLDAIAGSSSLTGPPSRSTRLAPRILPLRSQSAMSMPEIANAAMPPVVPYHQVSAYSFLPIVSVCSGFCPTTSFASE
jgi:hypothetical protein